MAHTTSRLQLEVASEDLAGVSDEELVLSAADRGYDAVAFLGREILASAPVVEAAFRSGLTLIATSAREPVEAESHLVGHLRKLEQAIGPERLILVLSGEVRIMNPTAVSAESP